MFEARILRGVFALVIAASWPVAGHAAEIAGIAATDTEITLHLANETRDLVRIYELRAYQEYSIGNPPFPIYTGTDDGAISLARTVSGEDRLYHKFQLADYTTREAMGAPQYVTDLSALSRVSDSLNGWTLGGLGGSIEVADGNLFLTFTGAEDLYVYNPELVSADASTHFVMRTRITSPNASSIPCAIHYFDGESFGRQYFTIDVTGQWQLVSVDLREAEFLAWEGMRWVRLDIPDTTGDISPYNGAFAEIDWIAVTDDPAFDGSAPDSAERYWDFSASHNFSYPEPPSIKGLQVQMVQDAIDLGVNHAGINLLVNLVLDSDETELTWEVDGETFGINTGTIQGLDAAVKPLSDAGMKVAVILLSTPSPHRTTRITPSFIQTATWQTRPIISARSI